MNLTKKKKKIANHKTPLQKEIIQKKKIKLKLKLNETFGSHFPLLMNQKY